MFWKWKKLCPSCKIGKYMYELDNRSDVCPYMYCYKRNKCGFYQPIETEQKSIYDKMLEFVFPSKK